MSNKKLVVYNLIAFLILVALAYFNLLSVNKLTAYGLCLSATFTFTYFKIIAKE